MSNMHLCLIANSLALNLIILSSVAIPPSSTYAASANLFWKPYLQQLTDTSVVIHWVTMIGSNPEVRYSTDTSYGLTAGGSTRSGAFGTQLHQVELTGLQPNTTYFYKVYTDNQDLLPDELLSFQTAPSTGSDIPFTFIAFGDFGTNTDSQKQLRDQMLLDSIDFVLTTGDNAYWDGSYTEFDTKVFQIYGDLFSKVAIFPSLGNHDYRTNDGAPYLDIFDLPQHAWRAIDVERYYSFDYGSTHFVVLDSNGPLDVVDSATSDDMFDWLRDDLSQTSQPWRIVAFHHPAYSTGSHGSDNRVQSKLVPIFEAYGVDLVFNGHDHIYQRSQPLRGGQVTTVEQGGIVYIVSGAGSAASYPCGSDGWVAIAYCSKSYGLYTRVTVNGSSLTIEAIDESGVLEDSYTINKQFDVPLYSVKIGGLTTGLVGVGASLTATVSPITGTLPITYTWQATEQSPVTDRSGLYNKVSFTWNTTGTKSIAIIATNAWASTTGTFTITIVPVGGRIFVPLILKS